MSRQVRSLWIRPWGVAGALLISLALAGCGRTIGGGPVVSSATQSSQVIPTAAPTYTAAPARPLHWQARPLPTPMTDPNPAISSANTGTAWVCVPHGSTAQIWVTHDGAQHWQRVGDVSASGPVDSCSVAADEVDPATAVVQAARRQPECCAIPDIPYPLAATHDGGKTWTQANGPLPEMSQLASYHGVSYAVFHAPFADASPGVFAFAVSSDGLHTWHRIDGALASQTQPSDPADARAVRDFWVNPATGELLVHSQTSGIWTDNFLTSRDGGATWHDLHAPIADQFLVRAPFAAGPWEICGLRTSSSSAQPSWPAPLICTLDSGKTWANPDDVSSHDNESFALANDGYVLAGGSDGMYRSAPGKSAWESLGSPPTNDVYWYEYQPGAGSGIIWALPQTSATNAPPATQVYVASYA